MNHRAETYIVFDTESVVDGGLLSRVQYPGEGLSAAAAIERYRREHEGETTFVPVTFHVPVAAAVARMGADFRLQEIACLDAPRFEPAEIAKKFWRGVQHYHDAVLVDFNGRGFDVPLLTLAAFRFGVGCPAYFSDPDRFGYRYRFTSKHIDLMEWLTEYGAVRLHGGLNLLAKLLGKPGKLLAKGDQVAELHAAGKLQEINDYCLHDALDTYFVFLRTRVLTGEVTLAQEQGLVEEARRWLEGRSGQLPALRSYLDNFGVWEPKTFLP
jgi:hypothetical protein